MQNKQTVTLLFDPVPKKDVVLPPLVAKPIQLATASLKIDTAGTVSAPLKVLANIRM